MFRKNSRLNSLQLQKQILIAESEINRAQLLEEWQTITGEVRGLTERVKSVGSLASIVALFASSVFAFRRKKLEAKHPWLRTGLNIAQTVGSIWGTFRARPR